MSGKEISEALSDISDEMVEQTALTREEKRSRGKMIWFRIAAMAATVVIVLTVSLWPRKTEDGYVTAPGILKVYGYDISTGTSIEDMEMRELEEEWRSSLGIWAPGMNIHMGIPLKYIAEDDTLADSDVTFHIRVNCGEFHGDYRLDKYKENPGDLLGTMESSFLGDDFVIENGETIEWRFLTGEHDWEGTVSKDGGVFVEAIIRADGHIVGYSLVKIDKHPTQSIYYAIMVSSAYYPKNGDQYQEVTEEYVRQEIANCKAEAIK